MNIYPSFEYAINLYAPDEADNVKLTGKGCLMNPVDERLFELSRVEDNQKIVFDLFSYLCFKQIINDFELAPHLIKRTSIN